MSELRSINFSFQSRGIVQKVDPSLLTEGEYFTLENMHSLQEGALTLRRGSQALASVSGGPIHTIVPFRPSAQTYLYVGEGTNIYRIPVGTWTSTKVADYVPIAGRGWSAAEYFSGESGSPYIFIAAGGNMLKDTGQLGTLVKWGIDPPQNAAMAQVEPSAPVYALSGQLSVITPQPGYWEVAQTDVTADLSEGGDPTKGFDSEDPIKISFSLSRADAAQEIRVLLSVGDNSFVNRYEKAISPSTAAPYLQRTQSATETAERISFEFDRGVISPFELPQEGQGLVPEPMPPAEPTAPLSDSLRVPKTEWLKVGKAGEAGKDWSVIRAVMIQVRSAVAGATVSVGPIALFGRYGPNNTGTTDREYKWVYAYRNSSTGHESAPSPLMSSGLFLERERARITVQGSSDPQVDKVVIYRGGGIFTDPFYRMVGEIGNAPGQLVFFDGAADADILTAPVAEFDNLPPPRGETCVHAFDSLFVGGIEGAPHVLAKSKTGRPESFPIVNEATGISHRINVGTPSDPIIDLVEFQGSVVSLNLNSIYLIGMWLGEMKEPIRTPAQRGVITKRGWTRADNEIWFLSYDGVYSWSGGEAKLRSYSIDWMFKGETVNGIAPLDLGSVGLRQVSMAFHRNAIWMSCRDTQGRNLVLMCEPKAGDRWHIFYPASGAVSAMVEDTATGILYSGRGSQIFREDSGGSDNGAAIPFKVRTGWLHLRPNQGMLSDLALELESPSPVTLKLYVDYEDTASAQFSVPATPRRAKVPLAIVDGGPLPVGREISAISIEVQGSGTGRITLHSMTVTLAPLADIQRGRTEDWDSLGYPYDKRLGQITIQYDAKGSSVTAHLDILKGILGNQQQMSASQFVLTGSGRSQACFQISDANGKPVVAKMVRLRYSGSQDFIIYDRHISFEQYPPDMVLLTEPSDWGTPYLKYFQQLVLDVDTGGVPATVSVIIDGVQKQQIPVSTVSSDRKRTLTLNPGISGRLGWIESSPGQGGKFQLFSHHFIVSLADKGPVAHSFDWDDLGHPYDKRLKHLSVEYEVTQATFMNLDGLAGPTGSQSVSRIMSIPLREGGRFRESFALPPDTTVKMVRLYPEMINVQFRAWRYQFDAENLPADVVLESEWSDAGWPYEKILRDLVIEVDTGSSPVMAAVDVDGSQAFTFSVSTSLTDRVRIITAPSDIVGKMFRIRALGSPQKFSLYGVRYNVIPEPPRVSHWDSYEINGGFDGPKILRRLNLDYISDGPVRVQVLTETGVLLDRWLPKHSRRISEMLAFPSSRNGCVNRTTVFRVVIDASHTFKFYREASWIELIPQTASQRQSYVRLGFGSWEAIKS